MEPALTKAIHRNTSIVHHHVNLAMFLLQKLHKHIDALLLANIEDMKLEVDRPAMRLKDLRLTQLRVRA